MEKQKLDESQNKKLRLKKNDISEAMEGISSCRSSVAKTYDNGPKTLMIDSQQRSGEKTLGISTPMVDQIKLNQIDIGSISSQFAKAVDSLS